MKNHLRHWRESREMTQQQLADAIGTSKPQISRLEASKRRLTTIWLEKLSRVYSVKPSELLRSPYDADAKGEHGGVAVRASDTGEAWRLPSQFVERDIHANPSDIEIYTVSSDTMVPTLNIGDRVVINVRLRQPSPAGIFLIEEGDAAICMRLQMIGAQRNGQLVRVSADNPHYVAYESKLAELRVRGRVVARLHRI